jgi:hypothetical protein
MPVVSLFRLWAQSKSHSAGMQHIPAKNILQSLPMLLLIVLTIASTCSAAALEHGIPRRQNDDQFVERGNPLGDLSISSHGDLHVRDPAPAHDSSTLTSTFSRFHATATAVPSSIIVNPTSSSSAIPSISTLPRAFDTPLGNNFSSPSCPAFFKNFTSDPNLYNCVPISLLLQVCSFPTTPK